MNLSKSFRISLSTLIIKRWECSIRLSANQVYTWKRLWEDNVERRSFSTTKWLTNSVHIGMIKLRNYRKLKTLDLKRKSFNYLPYKALVTLMRSSKIALMKFGENMTLMDLVSSRNQRPRSLWVTFFKVWVLIVESFRIRTSKIASGILILMATVLSQRVRCVSLSKMLLASESHI